MGVTIGNSGHPFLNSCLSDNNKVYRVEDNLAENILFFITRRAYKPILKNLFPNYYRDLNFFLKIFKKKIKLKTGGRMRGDLQQKLTLYINAKGLKYTPRIIYF